jgi:integrase/recombinase XerD
VAALLWAAEARRDAKPSDPRPLLLIRLLLDTGIKKGELVRVRIHDLGLEVSPPTLLVRYDSPRWAMKERRLAFNAALLPLIEAYRGRYLPKERLFECTARNLEYVLSDLLRAAGLSEEIGFEALRWTSAIRAWRAGVDPEALRERLGLSPITWAETSRKLELLADGMGPAPVDSYYPRG